MYVPRLFASLIALGVLIAAGCSEPPQPTINLYRAIQVGDLDQIKRHLFWDSDVNLPDPDGELPLHVAASRGRVVISRELLDHGADINAHNRTGQTPLFVALASGKTQVAALLVKRGAEYDVQNLLLALVRGGVSDRDTLAFLVKLGANINAPDAEGNTPLHIAVADENLLLSKRLIARGADVNARDGAGATPLQLAMENKNTDIIAHLQKYGANTTAD